MTIKTIDEQKKELYEGYVALLDNEVETQLKAKNYPLAKFVFGMISSIKSYYRTTTAPGSAFFSILADLEGEVAKKIQEINDLEANDTSKFAYYSKSKDSNNEKKD